MSKQRFYNLKNILKEDSQYNVIIGERSNGKSYAVKHHCILESLKDDKKKFIYLRRWDLELKSGQVEQYFSDVNIGAITSEKYNGFLYSKGQIFVVYRNDENKIIDRKHIGYGKSLSGESHYSSMVFADVENVIFEEFISRDYYLSKEPNKLMHFISTVARRRSIKIYLIGNTISRLCPYFSEWELVNIPKQKQGTIENYYHKTNEYDEKGKEVIIKISVEYTENSGNNSKMFFGSKSKMITTGAWQSEEKPHLEKKVNEYNTIYKVVFQYKTFKFLMSLLSDKKTNDILWYIEPKTTEIIENTRVISNIAKQDYLYTRGFIPLNEKERVAFSLIEKGKIFFSDNLTGTDFETSLLNFKN